MEKGENLILVRRFSRPPYAQDYLLATLEHIGKHSLLFVFATETSIKSKYGNRFMFSIKVPAVPQAPIHVTQS
jgi:hypothetical protein